MVWHNLLLSIININSNGIWSNFQRKSLSMYELIGQQSISNDAIKKHRKNFSNLGGVAQPKMMVVLNHVILKYCIFQHLQFVILWMIEETDVLKLSRRKRYIQFICAYKDLCVDAEKSFVHIKITWFNSLKSVECHGIYNFKVINER